MSKHIPQRMCIICRKVRPRTGLVRLARTGENGIKADEEYRVQGRGLYICRDPGCLGSFINDKKFKKRFHNLMDEESLETLTNIYGKLN